MAVTIEQIFPLGRFHATRWRQNPFEDRYGEWPPSPWRLLRAIAARWFQYTRETGDDDAEKRDGLLRALASELPAFQLPAATWRGQDLRQYQPTAMKQQYKYKKYELDYYFRQVSTTLSLDTYRAVGDCARISWIWRSIGLPREQEKSLADLLRRIHYFGRAESFTVMRLVENQGEPNCVLRTEGSMISVPVLAHSPDESLDIDILLSVTDDKRIANRPAPPGSAWYYAELPHVPRRKRVLRAVTPAQSPQIIRFALDSAVLPLVTQTLPVAEAARRALMAIHGRLTERNGLRGRSNVFSGKNESGRALQDHKHAYYLPTDEDGDGRLDHLTLIAREGFGPDEMRAIDRLTTIKRHGRDNKSHPLRVLLLGHGRLDEYQPQPFMPSLVWESATPYIATRYAKTRGPKRIDIRSPKDRADFLMADLRKQVVAILPENTDLLDQVEPLFDDHDVFRLGRKSGSERLRPIQFKRFRSKPSDDGGRRLAGAFRLRFQAPVQGPLALGYSSHFGMGLFLPVMHNAAIDAD